MDSDLKDLSINILRTQTILPVSCIIPTGDRLAVLIRTLGTIFEQSCLPAEVIIIDASSQDCGEKIRKSVRMNNGCKLIYQSAIKRGAARQRMQGMALVNFSSVWFLDDDVILEKECTKRLWSGFAFMENVGAVNALITNQHYTQPGFVTKCMYQLMQGEHLVTYAGKVIGPAWNLLPADEPGMPDYVPCEWLNTTCTMYRKEALPNPVFPEFFTGYSLMEDVALSLTVAKTYTLLNARTARIFHDSQPGDHKDKIVDLSRMELINRYFVMTKILGRVSTKDHIKLIGLELFGILSALRSWNGFKQGPGIVWGKVSGIIELMKSDLKPTSVGSK